MRPALRLPAGLLLLLALSTLACSEQADAQPAWGGLEVITKGAPVDEAARIVVLFHGYGAPGDDLVSLSQRLRAGRGAAFVLPAGPHEIGPGGRAWGRPDGSGFEQARSACVALLHDLRKRNPSAPLVLGGFSQGGLMAGSLLFEGIDGIEAGVLMSPAPVSVPSALEAEPPPVLITHGEGDQIIPISDSEKLRARLREAGGAVTWHSFDGGHAIPGEALRAMNGFLLAVRVHAKAGPPTGS